MLYIIHICVFCTCTIYRRFFWHISNDLSQEILFKHKIKGKVFVPLIFRLYISHRNISWVWRKRKQLHSLHYVTDDIQTPCCNSVQWSLITEKENFVISFMRVFKIINSWLLLRRMFISVNLPPSYSKVLFTYLYYYLRIYI